MAEVKNAFIKSKMNKDLDARLIPQGEYRDAVNIQVSKSEGDDVGALENVLGNISIADFADDSGVADLQCIGFFVNEFNSTVYLFFTNYTDQYNGGNPTYNKDKDNFIYAYDSSVGGSGMTKLVEGAFLNFSTNRPIIGVNVLENLLFFTDNRNQPRKINVNSAADTAGYYTNEDQISVAKYNPFDCIELIKESTKPGAGAGSEETTMYDVVSPKLPNGSTDNPYEETDFPGDPQFLEDKFVRFSYRFKFDDGEYSLIAPFTQACFIPKQDGYFLQGDEKQTFSSTIVSFMENKVNKIDLQIPLPKVSNGDAIDMFDGLKIIELDIIYKESDGLALQVVETIPVSLVQPRDLNNNIIDITKTVFEYNYNSTKPYKTLPSNEITRVYDKVPVRALSQEVSSNRIIYGNFQDKHTPPSGIKYQVAVNEKYESNVVGSSKSSIEYPNHNVKENRNYQVGVVLADRYGRQSTVILSNDTSSSVGGFGADTVYLAYDKSLSYNPVTFLGNSLKLLFNDFITSTKSEVDGQPGLYNGDPTDPAYNPLGWYSYKIVVKQLEQEYYNVYTNGAIKGDPFFTGTAPNQNTSFITLLNDNINKVPRDLSEAGPQDKTFRSSVRLFGRVKNTNRAFSNIGNAQFTPQDNRISFTTNNIEDLYDLFDVLQLEDTSNKVIPITNDNNPYYAFFRSESNPFVAEFITSQNTGDQFGLLNKPYANNTAFVKYENLAILETEPTVSRIDIFYESSTSGILSDLNTAVGQDNNGAFAVQNFDYDQLESDASGTVIVNDFQFVDVLNNPITPSSVGLISVIDNTNQSRITEFSVTSNGNGTYDLLTAATFYYGPNAINLESYKFTFEVGVPDGSGGTTVTEVQALGSLTNVPPTINNSNASPINVERGAAVIIATIDAVNGSADTFRNTNDLSYSIVSQTLNGVASSNFSISGNSVVNSDTLAIGLASFTLRATDAAPSSSDKIFQVNFGEPPVDSVFNLDRAQGDGDGLALWFVNNTTRSLTGNEGSIFNLGSGNTTLNGYQAPGSNTAPNNIVTNQVCSTPNPEFVNIAKSSGLTQGTFYAIIQAQNSKEATLSNVQTQVNLTYNIAYRQATATTWSSAADLNGESVALNNGVKSGTWDYYNNPNTSYGWNNLNNTIYGSQGGLLSINRQTSSALPFNNAPRVFAFNTVGEYRILLGNTQSSFGLFNNGPNCTTGVISELASTRIMIGDFYSPSIIDVAPDFNTYGSVYRYELINASGTTPCATSFSADYYYAKEPFANYVTQLYTDTNLINTANLTSGVKKFRRMNRVDSADGNAIFNPEVTKDGAYTATFVTGGLRSSLSIPEPCLF
jgi:hypothetical protein